MYNSPYIRPNLLEKATTAAKSFNFSNFLDGTQKTLGVINQAIPIVYQVKPIFQNAKTMFRIADEIRKPTVTPSTNNKPIVENKNKPIFYI